MSMHPGCTVFALKQTSGHYLLGSNSDDPWDSRTRLVCEKLGRYRFIATQLMCSGDQSLPWANMYTRGLNEKGLGFNYAHVEPHDGNWATTGKIMPCYLKLPRKSCASFGRTG